VSLPHSKNEVVKMAYKFPRTATLGEFTPLNGDVKAGTYQKVLEKVVPAQQILRYGTGAIKGGVDDRGTWKLEFKDASGNTISGWVRLSYADANEVRKQMVVEKRTEELAEGVKLEETPPGVKEDSKLVVEFKPDSDASIDFSKSSGLFPITVIVG